MSRASHPHHIERLARILGIVAMIVVAALLTAAAFRRVWGADFWWQWATGRHVSQHGIPRTDVFSFTAHGEPWIELRWLYCLGLYWLTHAFGTGAAVVAKCLLLLTTFALVTAAGLRRHVSTTVGVVLAVAILASSQRFFVRPELVSLVLFAVYLFAIERFRRRRERVLYALPLLQVIWTNGHTLFILGPLLVGLLCVVLAGQYRLKLRRGSVDAAADRRPLILAGIVLACTTLACFVNPYGWRGVAFPFQLFGEINTGAFKESISEFRSPFSFAQSYTAVYYYKVLIAICAGSALINWRRLDPFWTVLVISQLYLSAIAIRNIPLFCLAAIPFVLDNVSRSPLREQRGVAELLPMARVIVSSIVIVTGSWFVWDFATNRFHVGQNDTNQFGSGLALNRYPVRAVQFLTANGIDGKIFHTMSEGAYLLAHGRRVFIDPRLEVYGEERFAEFMGAISRADVWEATLDRQDVEVVLVDIGSRVINHALNSTRWKLVYFDEVAVIFIREDAMGELRVLGSGQELMSTVSRVRERLPRIDEGSLPGWWGAAISPVPYQRVADLLLVLGRADLSLEFLRDAELVTPFPRAVWQRQLNAHRSLGSTAAESAEVRELQRKLSIR